MECCRNATQVYKKAGIVRNKHKPERELPLFVSLVWDTKNKNNCQAAQPRLALPHTRQKRVLRAALYLLFQNILQYVEVSLWEIICQNMRICIILGLHLRLLRNTRISLGLIWDYWKASCIITCPTSMSHSFFCLCICFLLQIHSRDVPHHPPHSEAVKFLTSIQSAGASKHCCWGCRQDTPGGMEGLYIILYDVFLFFFFLSEWLPGLLMLDPHLYQSYSSILAATSSKEM